MASEYRDAREWIYQRIKDSGMTRTYIFDCNEDELDDITRDWWDEFEDSGYDCWNGFIGFASAMELIWESVQEELEEEREK